MPRRRSQRLFLSGVLVVASLAGSRLVGGRVLPLDKATRGQTASQLPSGVDGISFTVHPLGGRGPSDPPPMVMIHPIQTYWSEQGLFPAPPRRVSRPAALPRWPPASSPEPCMHERHAGFHYGYLDASCSSRGPPAYPNRARRARMRSTAQPETTAVRRRPHRCHALHRV
jgi:hypothetical protein